MKQVRHPALGAITLTGVLGALSDPIRLEIVRTLADGRECGWSEFKVGVAKSTLSHHMKTLREAGLTRTRQEGTRCFVSLRPDFEKRFPGLVAGILAFARAPRSSKR